VDDTNASYENFADEIIAKKRRRITEPISEKYISLKFIPATIDTIERSFSLSKYVYTDERQKMLPRNLEMVMFLKINRSRWDINMLTEILSKKSI